MTTTKEKNEIMYKNIIEHGKDLKRVFNLDSSIDEIKLCKALFRIENKAHSIAEDFCNGIYKIITKGKVGESYQFSSKEYFSIRKIVEMIYKKKNLNPKKYIINVKDRLGKDKDYKIFDNDTRRRLNWKNKTSINYGLSDLTSDKLKPFFEQYESDLNICEQQDEIYENTASKKLKICFSFG